MSTLRTDTEKTTASQAGLFSSSGVKCENQAIKCPVTEHDPCHAGDPGEWRENMGPCPSPSGREYFPGKEAFLLKPDG